MPGQVDRRAWLEARIKHLEKIKGTKTIPELKQENHHLAEKLRTKLLSEIEEMTPLNANVTFRPLLEKLKSLCDEPFQTNLDFNLLIRRFNKVFTEAENFHIPHAHIKQRHVGEVERIKDIIDGHLDKAKQRQLDLKDLITGQLEQYKQEAASLAQEKQSFSLQRR